MESSGLRVRYDRGDGNEYIDLFCEGRKGRFVYDGGTATYPLMASLEAANYNVIGLKEQINSLHYQRPSLFGPTTSLSEW